jgi:hypothetical protein
MTDLFERDRRSRKIVLGIFAALMTAVFILALYLIGVH